MRACNFSCGGQGRPSGEGSSGITDGRKLGAEQSRHLLCARSYRRAQRSQEEKAELGTCVRSDGEETRSERQAWAQHGGPERGWLSLCWVRGGTMGRSDQKGGVGRFRFAEAPSGPCGEDRREGRNRKKKAAVALLQYSWWEAGVGWRCWWRWWLERWDSLRMHWQIGCEREREESRMPPRS